MGRHLEFVGGVKSELEEQNAPLLLNNGLLDQAILEAASAQTKRTPIEYLLGCWKRVISALRLAKTKSSGPRTDVLKEAKRLCMSWCIFAFTMPDMFGRDQPASNPLVEHLLVDQDDDRGICHDFLLEITSRFEEDESAKAMMVEAAEEMSQHLARTTMNGNYKPYVLVSKVGCRK